MPTSADLIELIAEASGLVPSSVGTVYRRLRETNLIGRGGRGRNSLSLDLADATKVAVAALASGEARDAPETLSSIYEMKVANRTRVPFGKPRPGSTTLLKAHFFDGLAVSGEPRPRNFGASIDKVMEALTSHSLTPVPMEGDYAARDVSSPACLTPFARCEIQSRLSEGCFRVHHAALIIGIRDLYSSSTTFRAARGTWRSDDDEGVTITETRSVGLAVLERIAANFEPRL